MHRTICIILIAAAIVGAVAMGSRLAWANIGWGQDNYTVTVPAINQVGGAQVGSTVLSVIHTGAAGLTVTSTGTGVLTHATSGDVLTTSYKLTGGTLNAPDAEWVPAATFVNNRAYDVVGPTDITLSVQGKGAAGRANEAGSYAASVTVTLSWNE